MDWTQLFSQHEAQLEDFWGRRENAPVHLREFTIFGHPVILNSNFQEVLKVVELVQPLYSDAPRRETSPFTVQVTVRMEARFESQLPDNLGDSIQYTGYNDWLFIQIGKWGLCYIDLNEKRALAILSHQLANRPDLVSRYLINTILTNFLIANGYGFLHATGLTRDRQILMLMAPHNGGKSTLALRLAISGYPLLSDSMIFVDPIIPPIRLYGFPVGRIKLRKDMVNDFPELRSYLEMERVRDEVKYAADLRQYNSALIQESFVEPSELILCLLRRQDGPRTHLSAATMSETIEAVMANSIFYDKFDGWRRNLDSIEPVLNQARVYKLTVGEDHSNLTEVIDSLWS